MATFVLFQQIGVKPIFNVWKILMIGVSAGNSGGGIAFQPGMIPKVIFTWATVKMMSASNIKSRQKWFSSKMMMCWTRGSHQPFGPSPHLDGLIEHLNYNTISPLLF